MALCLKTWSGWGGGERAEGGKSVSTRSYKFLKISRAYKISKKKATANKFRNKYRNKFWNKFRG